MTTKEKEKETVLTNELTFSEAPTSWNTRYIDPNGFECQITLRGDKGSELLERANSAIAYLLKNGCEPYTFYRGSNRQNDKVKKDTNNSNNRNGKDVEQGDKSWSPIHEYEMKRWDKDGRVWYSHKVDGEWCRGKS